MTNLEEAKQRIKEVRERNESNLSINNLGLTSKDLAELIPIIKKVLTHLSELDLSGNKLEKLPNSLADFINLKRLYLDDNNLDNLPESLAKLYLKDSLEISLIDETKKIFDIILKGYPKIEVKYPKIEIFDPAPTDKSNVELVSNKFRTEDKSYSHKNLSKFLVPNTSSKRILGIKSNDQIDLVKKPTGTRIKNRYRSV